MQPQQPHGDGPQGDDAWRTPGSAKQPQDPHYARYLSEIEQAIVGHGQLAEQLLVGLICQGHCLFGGAPGSIQYPLIEAFAGTLQLACDRIACTPDLLPEEVWDAARWQTQNNFPEEFRFPQVLYAEEIHRAPPKTQAALLDAVMKQRLVWRDRQWPLPLPFMLIGSETEDEREARTLTSLQMDRFLFSLRTASPSYGDEYSLTAAVCAPSRPVQAVLSYQQLIDWQAAVLDVEVPPPVLHDALRLVRGTRVHEGEHHDFIYEWVSSGAGPRAAQWMVAAARARALLYGRRVAGTEDLRAFAHPVLRHRIRLNHNALSRGVTVDDAIDRLLSETPERAEGDERAPRMFRGSDDALG